MLFAPYNFRCPAILGLLNGLTACVLLCRQADALVPELGLGPRRLILVRDAC